MSLIEKIDAEIARIHTSDYKFNSEEFKAGKRSGLSLAKLMIEAEQKQPCDICMDTSNDRYYRNQGYKFCPHCGSNLNQPYTE